MGSREERPDPGQYVCTDCKTYYESNKDECSDCSGEVRDREELAMEALGKVEPPEGGWRKYSDMDML